MNNRDKYYIGAHLASAAFIMYATNNTTLLLAQLFASSFDRPNALSVQSFSSLTNYTHRSRDSNIIEHLNHSGT